MAKSRQLSKWEKEVRRLSINRFKETDNVLFNHYKDALREMKVELKRYIDTYEELSFSKRLEAERQIQVANRIDEILIDLNKWSESDIRKSIEQEANFGYYGSWYELEGAENIQLDFAMLPENYIEELTNKPVAGKRLSTRLYDYRNQLAERTTTALIDGAAKGRGYRKIAKEIGELTEANYKQALRIARTEGGRAQSTAKQRAYKEAQDKGVEIEKQWMSVLDDRTRHNHQILDGQTVDIEEEFTSPSGAKAQGPRLFGNAGDDINCRCTTITIVNGLSPELRRDNETGEVIPFQTYTEWAENKGIVPEAIESGPTIKINDTIRDKITATQFDEITELLGRAPDSIQKMWNKYSDNMNWGSTSDGNYFSAQTEYAFIKPSDLKKDNLEDYKVLFHEMAHNIDSVAGSQQYGNRFNFASSHYSDEFTRLLKKDADDYIKKQQKRMGELVKEQWDDEGAGGYQKFVLDGQEMLLPKKIKKRDAKSFVANELSEKSFKDISAVGDVFEGATGVSSKGGHGKKYWKNKDMLPREAFAHMTQTTINNEQSLREMKHYFPNAYEEYLNVVKIINEI
jgi:SPP1 gp7 family putative phage head morphogenesis protein